VVAAVEEDHAAGARLALQHADESRRDAILAAGEHNIEVVAWHKILREI
jgi:hypothetical protein